MESLENENKQNYTINIETFLNIKEHIGPQCIGGKGTSNTCTINQSTNSSVDLKDGDTFIQQLKNGLRNVYATKENWMHPLPILENSKHAVEDYYVDLDISLLKSNWDQIEKLSIPFDKLFCPFEGKRAPRSVLLTGDSGYGKSTLCLKIVQDWLHSDSNYMSSFEIVLFIRLRDVATTLQEDILSLCRRAGFDSEPDDLLRSFRNVGQRVLLVLDGYDEANEFTRAAVQKIISFEDNDAFMKGAIVFMTSRLFRTRDSTSILQETNAECDTIPKELECCERKTCINSLSKDIQHRYVDRFFKTNTEMSAALKVKLVDINVTLKLSPIILFIICNLHRAGYDVDDDTLFWEQYIRLIYMRAMSREKTTLSENELEELFDNLGELALDALQNNKFYIERDDVLSLSGENFDFLLTSGIFCKTSTFSVTNVSKLEIVHKGVMENLACTYLNNLAQKCNSDLITVLCKYFHPVSCICAVKVILKETKLIFLIVRRFLENVQIELKFNPCASRLEVSFNCPRKRAVPMINKSANVMIITHEVILSECINRITRLVDQRCNTEYSSHLIDIPLNVCVFVNFFFDTELQYIGDSNAISFAHIIADQFRPMSSLRFNSYTESNNGDLTNRELEFWNTIKTICHKRHYKDISFKLQKSMILKFLDHWLLNEEVVSIFIDAFQDIFFWLLAKKVVGVNTDLGELKSQQWPFPWMLITKVNRIPYVTLKRDWDVQKLVQRRFKKHFIFFRVTYT